MAWKANHKLDFRDDHYTPKWLFDQLNLEFDLDVAAPLGGVSWIPAKRSYSIEDNGLLQPWDGLIWMNPPYSNPSPWVDKFVEHGNGIALLTISRSYWFEKLWQNCWAICPTPRAMAFERPDGHKKQIAFQTMLFSMGEVATQALFNIRETRVMR
jgi:hypothetical protein